MGEMITYIIDSQTKDLIRWFIKRAIACKKESKGFSTDGGIAFSEGASMAYLSAARVTANHYKKIRYKIL